MKYAPASLPDAPAGGVSAGIDWASEDHAVCVVDAAGEVVTRFAVEHALLSGSLLHVADSRHTVLAGRPSGWVGTRAVARGHRLNEDP